MVSTRDVKAAKRFGLSYFIREQMELRGWTESTYSNISGFTLLEVQCMLRDELTMTFDHAQVLGMTFNTTARYWMNIEGRGARGNRG